MNKFLVLCASILLNTLLLFGTAEEAYATSHNNLCDNTDVSVRPAPSYDTIITLDTRIQINPNGLANGTVLEMSVGTRPTATVENGIAVFNAGKLIPGGYEFALFQKRSDGSPATMCNGRRDGAVFNVPNVGQGGGTTPVRGDISFDPANPTTNDRITVRVANLSEDAIYFASVRQASGPAQTLCYSSSSGTFEFGVGPLSDGTWNVTVMRNSSQEHGSACQGVGGVIASGHITISRPQASPPSSPQPTIVPAFQPERCNNDSGIATAIGCIPTNEPGSFVAWLFKWMVGIAGGIAFLLMVIASFQIMTASGNPEKLQGGRELLTAAISGLILIIFSVFLLQLIGVKILQIPGLGI